MPGKAGNTNALTHGMKSGTLPPGCSGIYKKLATFRAVIENAVLAERGVIAAFEVASIQTAESWHRHALLAAHWLRIAYDKLDHNQRLHFSREQARGFTERDRILKQLGLDTRDSDTRNMLYALPALPDELEPPVGLLTNDSSNNEQEGRNERPR
jgi:hypothetical protein